MGKQLVIKEIDTQFEHHEDTDTGGYYLVRIYDKDIIDRGRLRFAIPRSGDKYLALWKDGCWDICQNDEVGEKRLIIDPPKEPAPEPEMRPRTALEAKSINDFIRSKATPLKVNTESEEDDECEHLWVSTGKCEVCTLCTRVRGLSPEPEDDALNEWTEDIKRENIDAWSFFVGNCPSPTIRKMLALIIPPECSVCGDIGHENCSG